MTDFVESFHCDWSEKKLTNDDINAFFDDEIMGNILWFYGGYSVMIISFIIIKIYLILFSTNIICTKDKKHISTKKRIIKGRIALYIGIIMSMILLLISVLCDFLHILFPLIKHNKYKCGIRDNAFKLLRVMADFAQFWGYIILWYVMAKRLIVLFDRINEPVNNNVRLCINILFGIIIITTLAYNVSQIIGTEAVSDEILFGSYLFISVVVNIAILNMFSSKLIELKLKEEKRKRLQTLSLSVNKSKSSENNLNNKEKDPVFYITKYSVLFSLQLTPLIIRYIYRFGLALDRLEILERKQILWILSYAGMCFVFIWMYLFYLHI